MAWLLTQKTRIVPIPGTKKLERLQQNMSAAYVQLSDEDLKELNRIISEIPIYGERYQAEQEK